MNRNLQISRRLLNSIKTDGKGKAIPNSAPWFLRGNPIVKNYLLKGESKIIFQRRPLYWTTKKWAVGLMVPNLALCYAVLYGEDQFNKTFDTNQTTGCYSIGYGMISTFFLFQIAFNCW